MDPIKEAMIRAEDAGEILSGRFYESIARSDPKLERGQVWCLKCGSTQKVDSAKCLRHGWPTCCGSTMSIDSPNV